MFLAIVYWQHFGLLRIGFCRLSGLLATFCIVAGPFLSPIRLIGDTSTRCGSIFVAYPAYWRHFYSLRICFCRLSGLLATHLLPAHLFLSPIGLIGDTSTRCGSIFVAYPAYWRHFDSLRTCFCRLSGLLATLRLVAGPFLSPIRLIGDTSTPCAPVFVAYRVYWRHFCIVAGPFLSPIRLIGDTSTPCTPVFVAYRAYWRHFYSLRTYFCRLSGLLATLLLPAHLFLSPIRLIGDTSTPCAPIFVAYPAYWRHFSQISTSFCPQP
ncbi:hypothetical protein [Neobacillus niacini]|uniref:hypothetical protein n=1 Tax=Neobacillus niacini TaxID=86668 RepID=UPI002862C5AB|nr:hypothetical protein [Neobacillus niacini]MDR6998926.1 hypothetical protein [Neobacillus niacini]